LRRWDIDPKQFLNKLSPGERQRVALIRAIATMTSMLSGPVAFAAPAGLIGLLAAYKSHIFVLDQVEWSLLLGLSALSAGVICAWRWLPLQQLSDDRSRKSPQALRGGAVIASPQNAWWQQAEARVQADAGGSRHASLRVLLGPPWTATDGRAQLRHIGFLLAMLAFAAVFSIGVKNRSLEIANLLALMALLLAMLMTIQGLQRLYDEWRGQGSAFAEARLLPGIESATGSWPMALGFVLGTQLRWFASLALLLVAYMLTQSPLPMIALALLPWLALIGAALLPALRLPFPGQLLCIGVCLVLMGVAVFALMFGAVSNFAHWSRGTAVLLTLPPPLAALCIGGWRYWRQRSDASPWQLR